MFQLYFYFCQPTFPGLTFCLNYWLVCVQSYVRLSYKVVDFIVLCHVKHNFVVTDQISIEELDIIYKIPHTVPISAHHKWNFDDLLEKMWEYLELIRMYVLAS